MVATLELTKALIPRDYQQTAINFLRARKKAACWDKQGLGKTLTAILAADKPVLVVCPAYLVEQWASVIENQFPADSLAVANGSMINRVHMINARADWTVINVEMLRSYELKRTWRTLIFDEAHHLKGSRSKQARKALELAKRTPRVIQLTGTPIKNLPDDLYMQLKILDPVRFSSYERFCKEFLEYENTQWGARIQGVKHPEYLRDVMAQYAIRRSYEEAGRSLPKLIENVIQVDPTDEWRKHYDNLKNKYKLELDEGKILFANAMQVFTMLRKITACHEKYLALQSLLDDLDSDVDSNSGACVIFTWYRETAHDISQYLKLPVITGETPAEFRSKIARDNHRVVANIAAMSEGVDLSDKKVVIYLEEDHTPGMHDQSLTRILRERKDQSVDPVRCFYIHMKKSVDETIHNKRTIKNGSVLELLTEELNS